MKQVSIVHGRPSSNEYEGDVAVSLKMRSTEIHVMRRFQLGESTEMNTNFYELSVQRIHRIVLREGKCWANRR